MKGSFDIPPPPTHKRVMNHRLRTAVLEVPSLVCLVIHVIECSYEGIKDAIEMGKLSHFLGLVTLNLERAYARPSTREDWALPVTVQQEA